MSRVASIFAVCTLIPLAAGWRVYAKPPRPQIGTLHFVDDMSGFQFREIILEDSCSVVASGFELTEGPLIRSKDKGSRDGYLLFSDVVANSIFRWDDGTTGLCALADDCVSGLTKYRAPSGCFEGSPCAQLNKPGSNGLAIDKEGRLIVCEHGMHAITRISDRGQREVLVSQFKDRRLNSPNDLVLAQKMDLEMFFTDPPYGVNESQRELRFAGVFRYRAGNPGPDLITASMTSPNGIGLSADNHHLYVSNSDTDPAEQYWKRFTVLDDEYAMSESAEVFFRASDLQFPEGYTPLGQPDGLAVALDGTLFATGPGGVHVISRFGELLGSILLGNKSATNVAIGMDKFLYITARDVVCRIKTSASPVTLPGWGHIDDLIGPDHPDHQLHTEL